VAKSFSLRKNRFVEKLISVDIIGIVV
jgi:hypothetical protein